LAEGVFGDADPIGLGDTFEPGGDVYAVAEDVVALDQHVAEMDADAPFHSAVAGNRGVPLRRQVLQRQGAFDGADYRGELDQDTVAGRFEDPTAMLRDARIGSGAMLAQHLNRARLVEPHQPAVADYVGREDGGETAGRGHGWGRPPWSRIERLEFTTTRAARQMPGEQPPAARL